MIAQFHDGGVVADNQPVEAPPGTQDIPEKIGICSRGNAVQRVEGAHDGGNPGVHGSLVRRQVKLVEAAQRHIGRVVFTAGLCGPIGREVLHTGRHAAGPGQIAALIAAHISPGHRRAQIRVFASAFLRASPARVARDVHHGRIKPAHPGGRCFGGGKARDRLDQIGVEGRRQAEGNGGYCPVAVEDIRSKQKRNVEAALFDRSALEGVGALGAHDIERRSEESLGGQIHRIDLDARLRIFAGRIIIVRQSSACGVA